MMPVTDQSILKAASGLNWIIDTEPIFAYSEWCETPDSAWNDYHLTFNLQPTDLMILKAKKEEGPGKGGGWAAN